MSRSRSDSYPGLQLPEGCFKYKLTQFEVGEFAWEVHVGVCILITNCSSLLLVNVDTSWKLLAVSAQTQYSFGSFPFLPLVSDTTETSSPSPSSSSAQACQPVAENLPVCLELLGTQAGPGEDERQRKVDDRRLGDRWVEEGKQTTETRKWTEIRDTSGLGSESEVLAAQLQKVTV